ncbi:MAG TPA: hypothetical protein VFE33_14240 [Thermoanaerobaculia bacterium]|nr:hypothetical protein [Thermoanaerobaculia bacterium]
MLREWEDLDAGDRPVATWWHAETARLLTILLPALDREPGAEEQVGRIRARQQRP